MQRELARLASSGPVTVRVIGKQKHYQANPEAAIDTELRGIVQKTVGLAEPLRATLSGLHAHVHAAFVFGSIALGEATGTSDIDLVIVSDDLAYPEAYLALEDTRRVLGRPINPVIYAQAEFATRVRQRDAFVMRVLAQPRVWVLGSEHVLAA